MQRTNPPLWRQEESALPKPFAPPNHVRLNLWIAGVRLRLGQVTLRGDPMLDTMRNSQRWLTGIFIAVIGAVFIFFLGLGGPFEGGGAPGSAIIHAGNIEILPSDFYRNRAAQLEDAQERFKDSLDTDAIESFLDTQTIRQLTDKALLANAASEIGLQVTRQEIADFTRELPAFRAEGGDFDQAAFENYVEYEYGTQRNFMKVLERDLLYAKMLALIYGQLEVSEAEARDLARRQLETVQLGFVALDSGKLPAGEGLSEEEVASFLAENEDAARTAYESDTDRYQLPEARKARHILVRAAAAGEDGTPAARERAEEIHQSILDGAAFEDVALEHSDDPASRSRGGDIGYIARGDARPELEEAIYSLEPGGETRLVETDGGFSIVRVDEIRPESTVPFEEVSLEIARTLAQAEAAQQRARARGEQIAEAVRTGNTLQEAARKAGAPYQTSGDLRRRADGFLPGIGASPGLMAEAFSLDASNPTSATIWTVGPKQILVEWRASGSPEQQVLEAEVLAERERLLRAKQFGAVQDWIDHHRQALTERGDLHIDTRSVTGG